MSSFAEGRSLRILKDEGKLFLKYNQKQLSRIYPHGKRVNSSNYDPVPLWCAGSQLGKKKNFNHYLNIFTFAN